VYLSFAPIHLTPFLDVRVLWCVVINCQDSQVARKDLLDNCKKRFSQLVFRCKNAKGNGLPVSLESFPEKRGQKQGCFPSKVLSF